MQALDTASALMLLIELGYDATRQRLEYHQQAGYLKPPNKIADRFCWGEDSILDFAASLEVTRSWLPFSERHDHKKTDAELQRDLAECAGDVALFAELGQHTLRMLFQLLVAAEGRELRSKIAATIIAKLERMPSAPLDQT